MYVGNGVQTLTSKTDEAVTPSNQDAVMLHIILTYEPAGTEQGAF
jgi:hypothetical protein